MSFIYSALYLTTNIIAPIGCMIYSELKAMSLWAQINGTSQGIQEKQPQNYGNLPFSTKNNPNPLETTNYQCNYGKWTLLILSMLIFGLLNSIFPKSLLIPIFGFILKLTLIYIPQSIVPISLTPQTQSIQSLIQKAHLQLYLQSLNSKAIQLYLDLSEKINFFIMFYSNKERQEQLVILNRMKDSVSRIQLQLEENEQIKNRSFIVAVKKMQSMPKKIKSYENIGVNCDLLKASSDVGKQILKLLQEKTFTQKQHSQNNTHMSKIQQPTKDNFASQTKAQRSAINPARSQSLQQKVQKMKNYLNVPTSQKKRINQVKIKQTPFIIKRSQTDIFQQLQSQQQSPKRSRQNHHITWSNSRTQKRITRPQQNSSIFSPQLSNQVISEVNSSSVVSNVQNLAIMDIVQSQQRNVKKKDAASLGRILDANEDGREHEVQMSSVVMTQQPTSPKVIPPDVNISSIAHPPIHPFKLNLSNLTNPLVLSNTKILPNSVVTSTQHQIVSSIHNQPSNLTQPPISKKQFSNVSNVSTVKVGQHFSQQSSIPNKREMSINESDYSDMFQSDQEEEPKLEIKVEVIIENPRDNGLKPRMEIFYLQLYNNDELKFMSMHDKLVSTGKLLKIYKQPDNYYQLLILQPNNKKQNQSQKQQSQKPQQVTKKIKFRGQARPFMKYLQKP